MSKKKLKAKKINIILAFLCFLLAIAFILISAINYKKERDIFDNSIKIDGYIFGVRKKSKDTYAFEYKYVVNNEIYKTYLSSYKTDKELKDYDLFTVYYEKDNPENNVISEPKITKVIIAIPFSLILFILGILNLRRKKVIIERKK